ncbi:MAG: hypothetical protein D6746_11560, partial [Bacteroidetes bacterium]
MAISVMGLLLFECLSGWARPIAWTRSRYRGPETPSLAPEAALADYERAHHLNAEQSGPLLRMAAAHLILGQFDAARPL